ncbi:MAG: hypothetical protein V7K34_26365 [Nostoc sp.]
MIAQADHRLCALVAWVKAHRQILELSTGWLIGEKDTSDDRLARVVEELGKQEDVIGRIEVKLGQHLIRAYELPTEVARADTSSFSVNHQQQKSEQESLLRYGHSKDKRPDLLQYRQLLGTLDPGGIPLVSATLPGNGADDPLYWPTWQQMVKVIGHNSFVFLADCKPAAIATRGQIASKGGIYCFPVPMSGQHPQLLKQTDEIAGVSLSATSSAVQDLILSPTLKMSEPTVVTLLAINLRVARSHLGAAQ